MPESRDERAWSWPVRNGWSIIMKNLGLWKKDCRNRRTAVLPGTICVWRSSSSISIYLKADTKQWNAHHESDNWWMEVLFIVGNIAKHLIMGWPAGNKLCIKGYFFVCMVYKIKNIHNGIFFIMYLDIKIYFFKLFLIGFFNYRSFPFLNKADTF